MSIQVGFKHGNRHGGPDGPRQGRLNFPYTASPSTKTFRAASRLQDVSEHAACSVSRSPLLAYVLGHSAQAEQTILGWTLQQLQSSPILDSSILTADGQWDPTESVQLVMADLSLEDILRIWDALGPKYRLSVAYLARVVRIDRTIVSGPPVVATRFTWEQKEDAA